MAVVEASLDVWKIVYPAFCYHYDGKFGKCTMCLKKFKPKIKFQNLCSWFHSLLCFNGFWDSWQILLKFCSSVVMLHFDKGKGRVEEEYYKLGEETRLFVPLPSPPPHGIWSQSLSTNSFVISISLSVTEPCRVAHKFLSSGYQSKLFYLIFWCPVKVNLAKPIEAKPPLNRTDALKKTQFCLDVVQALQHSHREADSFCLFAELM